MARTSFIKKERIDKIDYITSIFIRRGTVLQVTITLHDNMGSNSNHYMFRCKFPFQTHDSIDFLSFSFQNLDLFNKVNSFQYLTFDFHFVDTKSVIFEYIRTCQPYIRVLQLTFQFL